MKSKRTTFLRGKRMRATLIDAAGRPVVGDSSVVTTAGFITVGMTANTEEGEGINVTNANGESCIVEPGVPTFNGVTVEAEFCEVDFALFEILTGQDVVLDASGRAIGITESTAVDLSNVHFALELWMGASSDVAPSAGSQGTYGYVLMPNLGGGVLGDITIENGAITFTISGMATRNGSAWGAGPYKVELVSGIPAVLSTPMKSRDHRRIMVTEVAPPTVYAGATPLLASADPAVTSVTTTVNAKAVTLAPVPTGTAPMWYDFGDGEWDYTANGSYVHTYANAGTYTITAYRGNSVTTKSVTVA